MAGRSESPLSTGAYGKARRMLRSLPSACALITVWAAAVILGGDISSPAVLCRTRIQLIERGIPKQPYHAAEKLPLPEAEKIIERAHETGKRLTSTALRSLLSDLKRQGVCLVCCGYFSALSSS